MKQENEQYAAVLAARAENCVKAIKILVISAFALAAVLIVYALIVLLIIDGGNAFIGVIVLMAVVTALFLAVIITLICAKVFLYKLKKLK